MTPDWQFRPITIESYPVVADLFAENGEAGYTAGRLEARYGNTRWSIGQTIHAPGRDEVVGFFGLLKVPYRDKDGAWHTALLAVDTVVAKAHRRKGVAAAANRWIQAQQLPSLNVGMNPPMLASLLHVGYTNQHNLHLAYRYRLARTARGVALTEIPLSALKAESPLPCHLGAHTDYARYRYEGVPQVKAYVAAGWTTVVQVLPRQVLLLELWGPSGAAYPAALVRVADALLSLHPTVPRVAWLVNLRWVPAWRWWLLGAPVNPRPELFCTQHTSAAILRGPLSFGLPDFVSPYPASADNSANLTGL